MDRKAFLGHKIRRLREEQALTQAAMAEAIGISTSYLNLLERNQRPITVPLLLKLGQAFDIDLVSFAEDEEAQLADRLRDSLADLALEDTHVPAAELRDTALSAPNMARAFLRLHRDHKSMREEFKALAESVASGAANTGGMVPQRARAFPAEEVRDFFLKADNHFPALEAEAETLVQEANAAPGTARYALSRFVEEQLGMRVKVMPPDVMVGATRRLDRHSRRILLSEMLPPHSKAFQIATQICWLAHRPLLDDLTEKGDFSTDEARSLARAALTNYFAGAVLMPYTLFLSAAKELRYDIDVLARRFGTSFEQTAHRLTTLQRPGARGVPFFLLKADKAGNISKRFSAGGQQFARIGGACPRWVIWDAFSSPGRIVTQYGELPDQTGWFTLARSVTTISGGYHQPAQHFALALGTDTRHAAELVYADGFDFKQKEAAWPIGLNCRVCERLDCAQRAFPPLNHKLVVDENVRSQSAYRFERR
ncbi:MAG: short-chain fatty acyl-CoA regulator family protein [Alphaproteobacteria bacterium]